MKMDSLRFKTGATSVTFPLAGADVSGPFILKGVDGLGPPEISVRMARTTRSKAVYQGKSPALRQVNAVVGLQPNWDNGETPEEVRGMLYPLLTPIDDSLVTCEIMYQGVVQAYCQGQISKLEPTLFSKDPAVLIVLDCDFGYLQSPVDWAVQTPTPFVSGLLNAIDVFSAGDAPTGYYLAVTLSEDSTATFQMHHGISTLTAQYFQVDGISWKAGDMFIIDTREGQRGVWRLRESDGVKVSILNQMNAGVSRWTQMYAGTNRFLFNYDISSSIILHTPNFWGV